MENFYLVCGDGKGQSTGGLFESLADAKEYAMGKCRSSANGSDKYYILKPVYYVSSKVKFDEGDL